MLGSIFPECALPHLFLSDRLVNDIHFLHIVDVLVKPTSLHEIDLLHFLNPVNTLGWLRCPGGLERVLIVS